MKKVIKKAAGVCVLSLCLAAAGSVNTKAETTKDGMISAGITSVLDQYNKNLVSAGLSQTPASSIPDGMVQEELPTAGPAVQETTPELQIKGYTNLGVANVSEYLNVREEAGEDSALVGKLPHNAGCEILEDHGEWLKIQSGKLTGFVKAEYLLTGDAAHVKAAEVMSLMATVTTDALKLREAPGTDAKILILISQGEELDVVEELDGWLKVSVDNDEGYVSREFVELAGQLPKGVTLEEEKYGAEVSEVRIQMVEYAKQFLGNPYVWGGTSLTNGADCSGFTQSIYQKFGVAINRTSREQVNNGTKVDIENIKPGDLLFYEKGGTINHVTMYIGGGQVIHASSPKTGIKVSNINYRQAVSAVNILGD